MSYNLQLRAWFKGDIENHPETLKPFYLQKVEFEGGPEMMFVMDEPEVPILERIMYSLNDVLLDTDNWVIEEFVGKDMNDIDMYEGDFMECKPYRGKIHQLQSRCKEKLTQFHCIGNIHQNPELING